MTHRNRRAVCCEPIEARVLFSTYYVAPGTGAGDGSASAPFRSIQQAAIVARPGDVVLIHAGTYRESVKPVASGLPGRPITFAPAGDGAVTISGVAAGVDPAVFLAHPAPSYAASIAANNGVATLYDPSLSAGHTGQTIHIAPGQGWVWQTGKVIASSRGRLTYTYSPLHPTLHQSYEIPAAGNPYYLTSAPVPERPSAFNLAGRSDITVRGIKLFASTVTTDGSSNDILLDAIDAKYVSTFDGEDVPWGRNKECGILLFGHNDVIRNSTIAYSSGTGVYLDGDHNAVLNCTIHDIDLSGGNGAGVVVYGADQTVAGNTVNNCGRNGIKITYSLRTQVLNNVVHDVMQLTTDGGGIYTFGTDGTGSVIAGNLVYNVRSRGFGAAGIYLDNGSSHYLVDHNTVYKTNHALKLNPVSTANRITHNVLTGNDQSVTTSGSGAMPGTVFADNVFGPGVYIGPGATRSHNVYR